MDRDSRQLNTCDIHMHQENHIALLHARLCSHSLATACGLDHGCMSFLALLQLYWQTPAAIDHCMRLPERGNPALWIPKRSCAITLISWLHVYISMMDSVQLSSKTNREASPYLQIFITIYHGGAPALEASLEKKNRVVACNVGNCIWLLGSIATYCSRSAHRYPL